MILLHPSLIDFSLLSASSVPLFFQNFLIYFYRIVPLSIIAANGYKAARMQSAPSTVVTAA